jgi:PhzF family phenazine biosynthesis protein
MHFKVFDTFATNYFQGNPTGVIFCEEEEPKELMQQIASELSLPHCLFVIPTTNSSILFNSLSFTPTQEVPLCTQGIIAALFAMIEDEPLLDGEYFVQTALGKKKAVVTTPIESRKFPVVFVGVGTASIKPLTKKQLTKTSDLITLFDSRDFALHFVQLGNKNRLAIKLPLKQLPTIALSKSLVMKVCQAFDVSGLIFFSDDKQRDLIRSRYFTKLLEGGEDAVTGIAAASILALYQLQNQSQDTQDLIVHQGGFATREGYLYTKYREEQLFIGGRAIKTAEGQLFY